MKIAELDAWLGKTLFIPPIIKICQMTRQSQFAVSRTIWFFVALDQLRIASSLLNQIIAGAFAIVMMLTASLRADMPSMSMLWFRVLGWIFAILDLLAGLLGNQWRGVEIWPLVLFAEYAATIRTIPPSEADKKRSEARRTAVGL